MVYPGGPHKPNRNPRRVNISFSVEFPKILALESGTGQQPQPQAKVTLASMQ
jgi:hypothetical protein